MPSPIISKSKYLWGLQCSKLLWYAFNEKDAFPPVGAAQQAILDQGQQVGLLATSIYPGGIEVAKGIVDVKRVDRLSREAVMQRKTLYEAGFISNGAYARADILSPVERNSWDIIEVKSSTEVKDVNLHDVALQRHVLEGAGLAIRNCYLLRINNQYVRKGFIDPAELFAQVDITRDVDELLSRVRSNLDEMMQAIATSDAPDVSIGLHCSNPYECPLTEICWKFLPDQSVFVLQRLGAKAFDLLERGIVKAKDIPDDVRLSALQQKQLRAIRSRKAVVDKESLAEFLGQLTYPLHFLDFESFSTAIPLFDQSRPYQQIPFQYSLFIQSQKGEPARHVGFLAAGKGDPRPEILAQLKKHLGDAGSIVAYNAPFEKARFREMSSDFPAYKKWWSLVEPRFVDLLAPFRSFNYYHPAQRGSTSMKSVLPVLTEMNYDSLEIADGATASLEFLRVEYGEVESAERTRVRKNLELYCATDTRGMIDIVDALKRLP